MPLVLSRESIFVLQADKYLLRYWLTEPNCRTNGTCMRIFGGTMYRNGVVRISAVVLFAGMCSSVNAAATQEQVDALGNCIRLSTSGKDRIATAKWMVGALGTSPKLQEVVQVDGAAKIEADKAMAALFTRLLTVDCRDEAKPVLNSGKSDDMESASRVLGEIAMQEIMTDKATSQAIGAFADYIVEEDFADLKK